VLLARACQQQDQLRLPAHAGLLEDELQLGARGLVADADRLGGDPEGIYMRRSLEILAEDGVADVIATTQVGATGTFRPGVPTDYLPALRAGDTIYVAGPPGLVEAVKTRAREAQAQCYADPFLPGTQKLSFADRLVRMWRRPAEEPALSTAAEARQTFGRTG
jgi:hypothetical protein